MHQTLNIKIQQKDVEYKEELVERIRRVMYDNEGVNAAMVGPIISPRLRIP